VAGLQQAVELGLACISVMLGFLPLEPIGLLQIGRLP